MMQLNTEEVFEQFKLLSERDQIMFAKKMQTHFDKKKQAVISQRMSLLEKIQEMCPGFFSTEYIQKKMLGLSS